jgi:hypothetical protein
MSLVCPSAQPDMDAAVLLGVVDHDNDGLISYLDHPVPVSAEVLALTGQVTPTRVLRFAAACEESSCAHFSDRRCSLASRIVDQLPEVVSMLPRCVIRRDCRWYAQEGKRACLRCPQVTTEQSDATELLVAVATPR